MHTPDTRADHVTEFPLVYTAFCENRGSNIVIIISYSLFTKPCADIEITCYRNIQRVWTDIR